MSVRLPVGEELVDGGGGEEAVGPSGEGLGGGGLDAGDDVGGGLAEALAERPPG